MDGWSEAEARTWLAMDLLAPVHELWAVLEAAPGAQVTAAGLLGDHRPVLTEAALAGGVDLERALVVGAALGRVGGFGDGDLVAAVECALVDEACRLPLMPLVNAAADLVLELEREAAQGAEVSDPVEPAGAPRGTPSGARSAPLVRPDGVPEVGVGAEAGGGAGARVLRRGAPRRRPARRGGRGDADRRRGRGSTAEGCAGAPIRLCRGRWARGPPWGVRSLLRWGAGPTEVVPAVLAPAVLDPAGGQGPRSQSRR